MAVFCSLLLSQLTTRVLDMGYFGSSWRCGRLLPAELGPLANVGVLSPLEQTVRNSEVGELPVRRRGLRARAFGSSCFRVVLSSHILASTSSLHVRTRCKVLEGSDKGKGVMTPTPRSGCLLLGGTLPQFKQGQDLAWMPKGRAEAIPQETDTKKLPETAFSGPAPLGGRTRMPSLPEPRSPIRPLNPPSNGPASSRFQKIKDPSGRACETAKRPLDGYANFQVSYRSASEGSPELRCDFSMSSGMAALP
jgi:hypothetical protein